MRLSKSQIIEIYSLPESEMLDSVKSGMLHPVIRKHYKVTNIIEQIYGMVCNGEISMGLAKQLVSKLLNDELNSVKNITAITALVFEANNMQISDDKKRFAELVDIRNRIMKLISE